MFNAKNSLSLSIESGIIGSAARFSALKNRITEITIKTARAAITSKFMLLPRSCKKNIKAKSNNTNQMVPCKSNFELDLCLGSLKYTSTNKNAMIPIGTLI